MLPRTWYCPPPHPPLLSLLLLSSSSSSSSHTHTHTYTLCFEASRWSWSFRKDRRMRESPPDGESTAIRCEHLQRAAQSSYRVFNRSVISPFIHHGITAGVCVCVCVCLFFSREGGGKECVCVGGGSNSFKPPQQHQSVRTDLALSTVLKCGEAEPMCTYTVHTVPWTGGLIYSGPPAPPISLPPSFPPSPLPLM